MTEPERCALRPADFYMSLYNVIFTVLPPLVIGMFDQDVDRANSRLYPGAPPSQRAVADRRPCPLAAGPCACMRRCAVPQWPAGRLDTGGSAVCAGLYQAGPRNLYFGPQALAGWVANAIFQVQCWPEPEYRMPHATCLGALLPTIAVLRPRPPSTATKGASRASPEEVTAVSDAAQALVMFAMVMTATQAIYADRASGTTFTHWEVRAEPVHPAFCTRLHA